MTGETITSISKRKPLSYHPTCRHCGGGGRVFYKGERYDCPICLGRGVLLGTTVTEES